MYRKLFSVRVRDCKDDMINTSVLNSCKDDYEYMIVFLKFIDFFKFILLNENNRCYEECVNSIELLIEETFIDEPIELLKNMTYFKRFCEMLEKPILEGMMNENA